MLKNFQITLLAGIISLVGAIEAKADDTLKLESRMAIGYEQQDSQPGLGIEAEGGIRYWGFGASVQIADMFVSHGSQSSGYYTSNFSNGQSRCRNASTGQFAKKSNCSGSADVQFNFLRAVDLTYRYETTDKTSFIGGIGIPLDTNRNSYGIVGVELSTGLNTKIRFGADGIDAKISFSIDRGRSSEQNGITPQPLVPDPSITMEQVIIPPAPPPPDYNHRNPS
jgi:hypothetical protein